MLAEKSQHTFLIFCFPWFPVLTSFCKNLINFFHRFAFSGNSDDIQFSFHNINFNQITFFYKCDRTMTWGILLFGLRGPAQRALIGKVNLATQIILNLGLCYGTLYLGPMWGNFLYFALEVLVFSVEAFVYNRYLPWPEGKKPHPILYALTANLLSFGIGLELNTHCTNTQIRLIGLVCLVLWYAGPWLCRKLRKVQNAQ